MRLLKNTSEHYEPFYISLTDISREKGRNTVLPSGGEQKFSLSGKTLEKYSYLMQNINSFEKIISNEDNVTVISKNLKLAIKRVLPIKESNLFFFDETKTNLIPFDNDIENPFSAMVNSVFKEGMLDWIFENGKPASIPEVNNFTVAGPRLNYIFYPIFENKKRNGLLALLSTLSKNDFNDLEYQSIQIILGLSIAKIEKIKLRDELNKVYNELQTYQAKLRNDFRLSAIGELTDGIVEDIKSPLQVILSYADLLSMSESEQKSAKVIKDQVNKINFLINRLVKFSNINEEKINIHPCNVNDIVEDYYNLISSSLENASIECVLDLEKDIPPVLSHPTYLYQLLSNIITIIKTNCKDSGGIIIQTRYSAERIIVKIINTADINFSSANGKQSIKSPDINFKIIENLMKAHEGEFNVESFHKNSSVIVLKFPLRRKIRK